MLQTQISGEFHQSNYFDLEKLISKSKVIQKIIINKSDFTKDQIDHLRDLWKSTGKRLCNFRDHIYNTEKFDPFFLHKQFIRLIKKGDEKEIKKMLIEKGGMINKADENGDTPLLIAARESQIEIVKLLLKNGAKIENKNLANESILEIAFRLKDQNLYKYLKTFGYVFSRDSKDGYSLHKAIGKGIDHVKRLLMIGAFVNLQNEEGDTPLHIAVRSQSDDCFEIIKLLINYYADSYIVNYNGNSILQSIYLPNSPRGKKIIQFILSSRKLFLRNNSYHNNGNQLINRIGSILLNCIDSYKSEINSTYYLDKTLNHLLGRIQGRNISYYIKENRDRYIAHINSMKGKKKLGDFDTNLEGFLPEIFMAIRLRILLELIVKLRLNRIDEKIPYELNSLDYFIDEFYSLLNSFCIRSDYLYIMFYEESKMIPKFLEYHSNTITKFIFNLEEGKELCLNGGFKGHSIYYSFEKKKLNGELKLLFRIDNLGIGNSLHFSKEFTIDGNTIKKYLPHVIIYNISDFDVNNCSVGRKVIQSLVDHREYQFKANFMIDQLQPPNKFVDVKKFYELFSNGTPIEAILDVLFIDIQKAIVKVNNNIDNCSLNNIKNKLMNDIKEFSNMFMKKWEEYNNQFSKELESIIYQPFQYGERISLELLERFYHWKKGQRASNCVYKNYNSTLQQRITVDVPFSKYELENDVKDFDICLQDNQYQISFNENESEICFIFGKNPFSNGIYYWKFLILFPHLNDEKNNFEDCFVGLANENLKIANQNSLQNITKKSNVWVEKIKNFNNVPIELIYHSSSQSLYINVNNIKLNNGKAIHSSIPSQNLIPIIGVYGKNFQIQILNFSIKKSNVLFRFFRKLEIKLLPDYNNVTDTAKHVLKEYIPSHDHSSNSINHFQQQISNNNIIINKMLFKGFDTIHIAIMAHRLDKVEKLLNDGSDITSLTPGCKLNVLQLCAIFNQFDIAKLLLQFLWDRNDKKMKDIHFLLTSLSSNGESFLNLIHSQENSIFSKFYALFVEYSHLLHNYNNNNNNNNLHNINNGMMVTWKEEIC